MNHGSAEGNTGLLICDFVKTILTKVYKRPHLFLKTSIRKYFARYKSKHRQLKLPRGLELLWTWRPTDAGASFLKDLPSWISPGFVHFSG